MDIEYIVIFLLAYALIFMGMARVVQNFGATDDHQFGHKNTQEMLNGLVFAVGGLIVVVTVLVIEALLN